MGLVRVLWTSIKSLFDPRALGEQTVETTNAVYGHNRRRLPGKTQHTWLAETWLGRMKARGENVNGALMRKKAYDETFVHACVAPGYCARSLALSFLNDENPMLVQKHPDFLEEYVSMVGPVLEAMRNGAANVLYRRYNRKRRKG